MNAYCLHKRHNAENVRLKARPLGRCPKARLHVIASYQARYIYKAGMLSKQCLDPGFWASPELMILNQSCLDTLYVHSNNITAVPLTLRDTGWRPPPVTVCRMDVASERTWKYLQHVTGGGRQLMSRIDLMPVNPDTVLI